MRRELRAHQTWTHYIFDLAHNGKVKKKETGNRLARRKSKKNLRDRRLGRYLSLSFHRNDPQARNHLRRYSGTDTIRNIFQMQRLSQPTHTKKVNIQHDTTDCFVVGLHVFLAHEFSLIYYTLTCFDGRARNWETCKWGGKKCRSACVCQCGRR